LSKGAKITYYRLLNRKKREVMLDGDAFFDWQKMQIGHFYLYKKNGREGIGERVLE